MRDVPVRLIGAYVLVTGAAVALAGGIMVPWLGSGGGMGRAATTTVAAEAQPEGTLKKAEGGEIGRGGRGAPAGSRVRAVPLDGAVAAAARMPASADLVMVIEHAADWRSSPFGEAAVRFLIDASNTTPTRQAWTTLASELGWSESETFDRLLGRRVVLVARGFGKLDTARWALLSDVSLETDQRLKTRLQASQRSLDQGHQILSVEKGKYELTTHRREQAAHEDEAVTIVLGPSGRSELFDEVVGVLARGADEPLSSCEPINVAAAAGASEILLLSRLGPPGGTESGRDRWADFFMLAGGRAIEKNNVRSDNQFTARVVYCDRKRRESNTSISPTSDAVFRSIAPGSLLTVVQAAPVQQILGETFKTLDMLRELPLPWTAQALVGSRQVLSLREMNAPGYEPADRPPLSAMLAVETLSPTSIAPIVDGMIARFLAAQDQMLGETRPPPRDFGGVMPDVARVLPLDLPMRHPIRLFVNDPLTLTWSFPTSGGHAQIEDQSHSTGGGWWVMSIAPEVTGSDSLPEQTHHECSNLLARADAPSGGQANEHRWVWLADARPSAIEQRLPGPFLLPDIGGFRSAMRRLDHVRVELLINPMGDIQGDLSARLAPLPKEPDRSRPGATETKPVGTAPSPRD